MAPRGTKPKPQGESRFRGHRMHGWIEVENAPFDGGPELPACRRSGESWPDWMHEKWEAWRTMPHARLWSESDWQYAIDTAEIAAAALESDAKIGMITELRFREKNMGTTWNARRDMRIRYTTPVEAGMSETVTNLESYREL